MSLKKNKLLFDQNRRAPEVYLKCKCFIYTKIPVRLKNLPLGWNILETNRTVGGLLGYSSVNSIVSLKVPMTNRKIKYEIKPSVTCRQKNKIMASIHNYKQ